ncbi:MAG: FeS assembly SUF system protein [Flavobacteriales bacterium]|nr:MAG: FeS assembly SUF system protein [Flavobacteriales bacterium]
MEEHKKEISKKEVEELIIETLKTIYDPEIPVDVYEMGLIYEINVDDDFNVEIIMTLTSPSCPVAESMPEEIRVKVEAMWSVKSTTVELAWEPPWTKDMMSEEALLELGFM